MLLQTSHDLFGMFCMAILTFIKMIWKLQLNFRIVCKIVQTRDLTLLKRGEHLFTCPPTSKSVAADQDEVCLHKRLSAVVRSMFSRTSSHRPALNAPSCIAFFRIKCIASSGRFSNSDSKLPGSRTAAETINRILHVVNP